MIINYNIIGKFSIFLMKLSIIINSDYMIHIKKKKSTKIHKEI